MINISADDAKLFEQNGFTKEQVRATVQHYREQGLSDDDIQLKMNNRISEFKGVTLKEKKQGGIDLTPSGIVDTAVNAITAGIETPVRMVKDKQTVGEAFKSGYESAEKTRNQLKKQAPIVSGINDFATDVIGYSALPNKGGFIGRAAIQGGVPMALESLKAGQNPLGGFAGGTALGGAIQGLPYVGKVAGAAKNLAPRIASKVAQIEKSTIEQALKPSSKALDLTKEEAERLAQDTTERFRDAYETWTNKLGENVADKIKNLKDYELKRFDLGTLENDIKSVFNKYQKDQSNVARELTGNLENELIESINAKSLPFPDVDLNAKTLKNINPDLINSVSPLSLQGEKEKIGQMINWDDTKAKMKNRVLEQLYGLYNKRISNLSPELTEANRLFANAENYVGKKSRLRNILNPNRSLSDATSSFKNYKSTDDSIFQLEKELIEQGNKPFLGDINDAIAAQDLLKKEGTGLGGLAGLVKEISVIPALKVARAYNRSPIPQVVENVKTTLSPLAERLLTPTAVKTVSPILYGGVSYNDY